MHKTKLQELCHQKLWSLPNYSLIRDGPDHFPRFKASVLVNGVSFDCPVLCKSSKEAQNEAARIALERFTSFSSPVSSSVASWSPYSSSTGSSSASSILRNVTSAKCTLLGKSEEISKFSPSRGKALGVKHDQDLGVSLSESTIFRNIPSGKWTLLGKDEGISKISLSHGNAFGVKDDQELGDVQYLCKSQLQNYVQKRSLSSPVYSCIRQGSPHAPRFKAMVTVDGQTFESPEFFRTLREAEHGAAKVALFFLPKAGIQEDDCALYKNLLQDFTRKEGFSIPVYATTTAGASHQPTFTSTVEVEGDAFRGVAAKTKKQAEMNAAKVAYFSLKERQVSRIPSLSQSCDSGEDLESICSSSPSNIAVDFRNKLNLGRILHSTPIIRSGGQVSRIPSFSQSCDSREDLENICSSSPSNIADDFQNKLTMGRILNSTPIIRSEDNRGGDQGAGLTEVFTNNVKTNDDHPTTSPVKPRTGFERLLTPVPVPVPIPSAPLTECGSSSSPTTVLEYSDCSIINPFADLPATESKLLCNRVRVYPWKPDRKFEGFVTVLPISDDQWVGVSLDYPKK